MSVRLNRVKILVHVGNIWGTSVVTVHQAKDGQAQHAAYVCNLYHLLDNLRNLMIVE